MVSEFPPGLGEVSERVVKDHWFMHDVIGIYQPSRGLVDILRPLSYWKQIPISDNKKRKKNCLNFEVNLGYLPG